MFATFVAAVVLAVAPVLPIPQSELHPTGDQPGTWDFVFTHDELAHARAQGGFDQEMRRLIAQRLTAPAPQPKSRGGNLGSPPSNTAGVEQWRGLVSEWPWPVDQVLAVMACESGGNPNAVGAAGEIGLMQIHPASWEAKYGPRSDWFDPHRNLEVAFVIWSARPNWADWTCRYVL